MEGELKRIKNLDETVWSSAASQSFRFSNRLNSGSDGSTQVVRARSSEERRSFLIAKAVRKLPDYSSIACLIFRKSRTVQFHFAYEVSFLKNFAYNDGTPRNSDYNRHAYLIYFSR